MLHGIVRVPVTDLRAKPDMYSERVNQALFGTPVVIHDVQKEYSRIVLPDGYTGWCRTPHVWEVAFKRWQRYRQAPKHKVKAEQVLIKTSSRAWQEPFRLFFGTEVVAVTRDGQTYFELPGGLRAPISKAPLIEPIGKRRSGITAKHLVTTAQRFLGVPYLWGGITPLGFDCSGLIQAVSHFHGLTMPRDSRAQRQIGFEIKREELRPGDIVFFPGHVALSCGGDDILHASASRGMVAIESLDPAHRLYRKDLDDSFESARRLSL